MSIFNFRSAIAMGLFCGSLVPTFAADQNGYTAQYECRAGGPYCNVDVAALGQRACNQIISVSTPWSSINWSNDTICLAAGDHTSKGTLHIPSLSNGSAGRFKILRYYRPADTDDEPWHQSDTDKAKISRLVIEGDYWVIHRITFPPQSGAQPSRVMFFASGTNDVRDVVVNRVMIEGSGTGSNFYGIETSPDGSWDYQGLSVQNSVLRNVGPYAPGWEALGISLHVGLSGRNSRYYIVNNEIYDWVSHPIQLGRNEGPTIPGMVVENNDLYVTPALHTADGRSKTESLLSLKVHSVPEHPTRVIRNRIWGARPTDTTYCCNGELGDAIANYHDQPYILVHSNIIGESQIGSYTSDNSSWIGNLFYGIRQYYNGGARYNSHVLQWQGNAVEAYLNTVIDNPTNYSFSFGDQSNGDVRCNVFLSASGSERQPSQSSFQVDHNAFYDSPTLTFNGSNTNFANAVTTRRNSATYRVNDIIRTGPVNSCNQENDSACFLYKVTVPGDSAPSSPGYCTTLGCTTTDGTMVAMAIRGPYVYHRKLRTAPERYVIPYVRPYAQAPEAYGCPADFAKRIGIGIGNDN